MKFPIGIFVVIGSVIGGYLMHHGKLSVLVVPNEYVIIIGSALGSMIIGNSGFILKDVMKSLKKLMKKEPYSKQQYLELLTLFSVVFKLAKSKGLVEIEKHIETPHESQVFQKFPLFLADHHAEVFFCDYMRMLIMGVDNHYQIEDLLTAEIEGHHHHGEEVAGAINNLAESFPALGIVAAVLGVITTMGSINEPPAVLGGLIGSALVGTFLGVLLSYGIVGPMGRQLGLFLGAESKYFECIKAAIIAHMRGHAPTISVEFARKIIPEHLRPTFQEVEEAVSSLSTT